MLSVFSVVLLWSVLMCLVFDFRFGAYMRTLYICYFGLREPLVQAQVLPYLRELIKDGIDVYLMTFEPSLRESWSEEEKTQWKDRLQEEGIEWNALAYHKRPSLPATLYDIAAGTIKTVMMAGREKIDVLHARTHIPMAMVLLARLFVSVKTVFDIRGLLADEYVDAGIWRKTSTIFRVVKWLERSGIVKADQIIVLTESMREWLIKEYSIGPTKIEVIPCCVDFSRFAGFRKGDQPNKVPSERLEVAYAGSVTGLYMLEEMGKFFLALRKQWPETFLRILTVSPAVAAAERLRRAGLSDDDFWIGAVPPDEVPYHLKRSMLGLSFRKPAFSQIAVSPTKIPEYLAMGIPVVTNAGIGDTDRILKNDGVGVIVEGFHEDAYLRAVEELKELLGDPELPRRCKRSAGRWFDIEEVGGVRYRRVYRKLFDLKRL